MAQWRRLRGKPEAAPDRIRPIDDDGFVALEGAPPSRFETGRAGAEFSV